jgi:amino acid adenylation domain-containing protein
MSEEVFVFPLSFAQQRLWFLDQISPGNPFYNVHDAIYFDHPLDVEALKRSIAEIARRHESLRTTFVSLDGQPVQVVAPMSDLPLPLSDLSRLSESEREAEMLRISGEEAVRPFDLARGPLVRTRLLRLDESTHVLLLTMHHIISDGWSLEVLVKELRALYEAFSAGERSPLPELPIQYADFAVWQRDWLRGEVLAEQLSYWKNQLAHAPASLELPADRPRPLVQTFRGASQWLDIPGNLTEALKAFSQREGVTLFMTLLAAFKALLYRYTGQEDIVVGSPIAGRNREELDGLIGFFVNTLVLRTRLSADLSFRALVRRVRETALGAYAHQDLPFEKLVEELHPVRDTSRTPLVQVMFALQSAAGGGPQTGSSEESAFDAGPDQEYVERGSAKFDLSLALQESDGGLSGCVEYSTDLFDDQTITRMIGHFRHLLEGVASNPDQLLSRLPLLAEAERRRLLFEWNETRADYPQNSCLHELFEAQVERSPDAVAVTFAGEQLTYAELNGRANQLARRLRAMGVRPESLVGICMERSVEMLVGLLGILKAGGAYVPLDPEYPKERLAFMLEDAGVSVLLAQKSLLAALPGTVAGVSVFLIDADQESAAIEESKENLREKACADNLAFMLYTSGSSGIPKGVSITHRAVISLVCNNDSVALHSDDRVGQGSSVSFDAATVEIWKTLLHGAQLVGISRETLLSPHRLARQVMESKISILFLTTALFNQFADDIPGAFGTVRYLMFGGEAADPARVREVIQGNSPPGHLLNLYGPTECTTFATWNSVKEVPVDATNIPIGRPVANAQLYILDSELQPVPVGVTGEIYLGGERLARGYHRRPDLTAEKFLPSPFSRNGGERLYRTGDLARYLPDGQVEFIGRRDNQVKLRGFRVELGEIEAVLRGCPGLKDAVVTVRDEASGDDKRLVAYLVADEETLTPPAPSQARAFLRERLPEYMIPHMFVPLDHLPLTANGKIDRSALPEPLARQMEAEERYVAPQTEMERRVALIWQQVLGVEKVGIHDNFFDLGGHSLLIVRVHNRLRETLGREIPIVELFRHPTVTMLAEYLGGKKYTVEAATVSAFDPVRARAEKRRQLIQRQQQTKERALS